MITFTPDMARWLADNREDYEFYLLHAILHDPLRRSSLLNAPLIPDDFRREDYALIIGAMRHAIKVMSVMGGTVPVPPTAEYLRTYIMSAAKTEGSEQDIIDDALRLAKSLEDPKYKEMHQHITPYFEAWYGTVHAKRAARQLQSVEVPDVVGALSGVQMALSAASQAVVSEEDDEMNQFLDGEDEEQLKRRSTGIKGLDLCLNGGWGEGECYLLFGGTGGGKSIAAAQCAWNEADSGGYPLIISTELKPREYGVRIVSAAASVAITAVQDCLNLKQIVHAVATNPRTMFRQARVKEVLDLFRERVHIAKVPGDDGLEARVVLEREVLRYENKFGRRPTWVCLDWLGTVADVAGSSNSSERAMAWEVAANGCVKFAETTGIPTLVLAQAVNDAQNKRVLTIRDIGISKGIGKNMTLVVGVTNAIDHAAIKLAEKGKGEMPREMALPDQLFCVCKARKGEGRNIPVRRDFKFQRFVEKPMG